MYTNEEEPGSYGSVVNTRSHYVLHQIMFLYCTYRVQSNVEIPIFCLTFPSNRRLSKSLITLWLGWCTIAAVVTPMWAIVRNAATTCLHEEESKPLVGSSRNSTNGSATISRPTFTRFLWPPEMPLVSSLPISSCLTLFRPST